MQKRICWKKGMRLSDDIMRASDEATAAWVGNAMVLAAAGQFGLFPGSRPFRIALNISNGAIEVVSLSCLAITKGGDLIDIQFDSKYSNPIPCRIAIPQGIHSSELFLTINVNMGQWKETTGGFEEPICDFSLVDVNSPIADYSLPIAHIIDTDFGGWHVDESDFLPPCLFVSSHQDYVQLLDRFIQCLKEIESKSRGLIHSEGKEAIRVFWPIIQQILIDADRGRDLMTPMSFMADIQKTVCAFTTACDLDEYLNLADAESFRNYALTNYNFKNVYKIIKEGLDYCLSINEKLSKIQISAPQKPAAKLVAPYINDDQLIQNCKSRRVSIPIVNPAAGSTVFYSTDGSEPSVKLPNSGAVSIENGFNKKKAPEPDKTILLKLKAVGNGTNSEIAIYTITLHKDYKVWDGYEI